MRIEQLLEALRRSGESVDKFRNMVEYRLDLESVGNRKRVSWKLDPNNRLAWLRLVDGSQVHHLRLGSDEESAVEFWEEEGRCGIILQKPKSISWEFTASQLQKLATAKAAGLACAVGATAGFATWLALNVAHRLMESSQTETETFEEH